MCEVRIFERFMGDIFLLYPVDIMWLFLYLHLFYNLISLKEIKLLIAFYFILQFGVKCLNIKLIYFTYQSFVMKEAQTRWDRNVLVTIYGVFNEAFDTR